MEMTLTEVKNVEILKRNSNGDNFKLLFEFANSNMKCAEVGNFGNRKPEHVATSLRASAKKFNMNSIDVARRGKHVYLVKKDIE